LSLVIALDGMGGDAAPTMVVDGAALALERDPDLRFVLFGDEARLRALLDRRAALRAAVELVHTPDFVAADARPSSALRQGRSSSMRLAIDAVKEGRAAAAVSAGNTGALMAMAKVVLRTLPGIDRPAICGVFPSRSRPVAILDLGANVTCDAEALVQFAVMGTVFARAILGIEQPSIGLLNVGTEELKGDDVVRRAADMLRASPPPIRFGGFVEGTDLVEGSVDVVVTDGFTGNVALKIAEGVARMFRDALKETFSSSLRGKLGYLVARPALAALRERFDPRRHNGAMFLGLNGVVVKSHGGTDALGFSWAVKVAADLVRQGTNARITEEMRAVGHALGPTARAAAS
jgi:glycerol-3-phosphate acyltransferase PlsX